jgi:hypothetical protein
VRQSRNWESRKQPEKLRVESGKSGKAEMLVRSEKTCVSEGESPSSSEAKLPKFGTRVTNGKV